MTFALGKVYSSQVSLSATATSHPDFFYFTRVHSSGYKKLISYVNDVAHDWFVNLLRQLKI